MYRFLLITAYNAEETFCVRKFVVVFLLFCVTVSCVRNNKCPTRPTSITCKDTLEKEIRHVCDPDSLLKLYNKSLDEGNMVKRMVICGKYAKVMRDMSDFSSAIKYNLIGLDIAEELNDTIEMVKHYNSLGTNFRRLGAFAEAMGYHSTAMELVETFSDTVSSSALKNKTVTYNGMGNISLTMGYGNEVKKFFRQALGNSAKAIYFFVACIVPKVQKPYTAALKPSITQIGKAAVHPENDLPTPPTNNGEIHHAHNTATQMRSEEEDGMTWIENKFFAKATSIETVYQETIRKGEIEDSELLLPQLPKGDKEVHVGTNGLISVSYKVNPRRVEIEMLYEGGVTTLNLRLQSGVVSRTITHSAD